MPIESAVREGESMRVRMVEIHRDSGWRVLDWVHLRSAGVPVETLEHLSAPEVSLAWRQWEAATRRRREAVSRIDGAKGSAVQLPKAARRFLERADAPSTTAPPGLESLWPELGLASTAEREARAAWRDALDRHWAAAAAHLAETFESGRVADALSWQNPKLHRETVERLDPGRIDGRTRKRISVLGRYLARYAAKNETIGFFGPSAWARWELEDSAPIRLRAKQPWLAKRRVFFERWPFDQIVDRLNRTESFEALLPIRLSPDCARLEDRLRVPLDREHPLDPLTARIIRGFEPGSTCADLLRRLEQDIPDLDTEEAADIVQALVEQRVLIRGFQLDPTSMEPAKDLAATIRGRGRAELDDLADLLERLHADLERWRFDEPPLPQIEAIERELQKLGAGTEREGGKSYAGRKVVFEETVRNIDVRLGASLLRRVGPPLASVATSARAFTAWMAEAFREAVSSALDRRNADSIDLQVGLRDVAPILEREPHLATACARLEATWAEWVHRRGEQVDGDWHLDLESAEAAAAGAFRVPAPGWPSARQHGPDLLVEGTPRDLEAGRFTAVLGEFHVALNPLTNPVVLALCPVSQGLLQAEREARGPPRLWPAWSRARTRADHFSLLEDDLEFEQGQRLSHRPQTLRVPAGVLRFERVDGRWLVVHRQTRARWELEAFFDRALTASALQRFSPFRRVEPEGARVWLGELMVRRRSWRIPSTERHRWLSRKDPAEAQAEVRAWWLKAALPRRCFVAVEGETKPMLVDREAPVLVAGMLTALRTGGEARLSEMRPDLQRLWLRDDRGSHTSELRMTLVDPCV